MRKKYIVFIFVIFLVLSGPQFKCSEDNQVSIDSILVANQHFAFDLYHQLKNDEGNLFFSPYSISTALAMTYAGAKGETKEQMESVLHFNPEVTSVHKGFGLLNDSLNQLSTDKTVINTANGLWADSNWKFLDSYIELVKSNYRAEIANIDMKNAQNSAEIINKWTEEKTSGKITEIVNPDDFDLARLVLANAIYFKGMWKYTFDEEQTKKMHFYMHDKSRKETDFMSFSNGLYYYEDENCQVLELPYAGDDLSMLVLLPNARNGIRNFEEVFTLEQYEIWMNSLKNTKMNTIYFFRMS